MLAKIDVDFSKSKSTADPFAIRAQENNYDLPVPTCTYFTRLASVISSRWSLYPRHGFRTRSSVRSV